MKKFYLVIIVAIAAIIIVGAIDQAKSEVISDYTWKPYAFGGVYIPLEKGQNYTISRMRLGVDVSRSSFVGNFDWNATKVCLHTAFGGFTDTVAGFKTTVIGGRFLNPVFHVWPGPKMLEQTRWFATITGFSLLSNGLKGTLVKGEFSVVAANYTNGTSAAMNWKKLWLYWDDMVGYGLNYTLKPSQFPNWWPEITFGYSGYKNLCPITSALARVDLTSKLRAYAQVDTDHKSTETLSGLTYVYNPNGGFIKVYYDSVSKWIAEFTFTF